MKFKKLFLPAFLCVLLIGFLSIHRFLGSDNSTSGAPPYGESDTDVPLLNNPFWLRDWQRPDGPAKVALQVGHWKNEELPEELARLKGSTGSKGGGQDEWQVNLAIAQETAQILENKGVEVEILPATIPPSFWTDVFLAIHADGSTDLKQSGFKIAGPWRDLTDRAESLVSSVYNSYEKTTGLAQDGNITHNMRGYYAFSWWRYEHSIHPMTTAAIIETGFLTSYSDRKIIVNQPKLVAQGIAQGILDFLETQNLIG